MDKKDTFWNKNINIKSRIALMTIGIVTIVVAYFLGFRLYEAQDDIWGMFFCAIMLALGVVFCIINFNFENRKVKNLMWVLLGMFIAGNLLETQIRTITVLTFIAIVIFIITMRFKNVFSTIVTLSAGLLIVSIIMAIIANVWKNVNESVLIYITFSLLFVSYRIFGVKVNRFFIGTIMGYKNVAKTYDDDQLKNQITLMYLIAFVLLNIMCYLNKVDSQVFNLIDSSFLTGLTITQVDWNRILYYFKRTSRT